MKRVCVFCGSNMGASVAYRNAAYFLGRALAERKIGLVYGGGQVGLMGIIADTVIAAGGEAIGVIPEALATRELAHRGLSSLHVVASMHERKAMMAELADAFVALPGGFGTFEELCEVITWAQLGLHRKPCGLLNVEGYYDSLLALFDHATTERFVRYDHRSLVLAETDIDALIAALERYVPPDTPKWIREEES